MINQSFRSNPTMLCNSTVLLKGMENIKATHKGYHGRKIFNNMQMFCVTVLIVYVFDQSGTQCNKMIVIKVINDQTLNI